MLDVVKEIAKYPLRIPSAFAEAVKKAKEDQDSGFFEKLGIFFSAFTDAMSGINTERKDVAKGAEAAVQGSISQTLKHPTSSLRLKKQPTTTNSKNNVETFVAIAARGHGRLDRTSRAHAHKAIKKLENNLAGKPEKLNFDEVVCLEATSISILLELKRKYPNKKDFKKALDSYAKASEGSNFPLNKIMRFSTLKLFSFGKDYDDWAKLIGKLGIGLFKMPKLLSLLDISKSPLKNEGDIVATFKEFFFPNTSSSNLLLLVRRINKVLVSGKGKLTTEDIAEITFLIDESDLDSLIQKLTKR